jgi:uncharacterized protein
MADITPPTPAGRQIIQSYGDGGFRIAGIHHRGSVLVLPEETRRVDVTEAGSLTQEVLGPVLAAPAVEILIVGCGSTMTPLDAVLRAGLRSRGVVVEPMDTGAACRTFNVLLSDGRPVAALLIAVD